MSYTNDWSDQSPIDHTQFKNIPSSIRQIRIDIEQRLSEILYGFIPGETLIGAKSFPLNTNTDPGAVSGQIQIYSKVVNSNNELFAQDSSGNVTQITSEGTVNATPLVNILEAVYPVGSTYFNVSNSANPATIFGFGTWASLGGYALVGFKSGDPNFGSLGAVAAGEAEHTLTVGEVPPLTINIPVYANANNSPFNVEGGGGSNTNTVSINTNGGGGGHNNIQPSFVGYMWQRTA